MVFQCVVASALDEQARRIWSGALISDLFGTTSQLAPDHFRRVARTFDQVHPFSIASKYLFSIHIMTYSVFGLGNPLLDLQTKSADLLEKYGLKANDAILAEDKHEPLYDEVMKRSDVEYTAGGAAQNAMRGASYMMEPNSTVYVGCVGKDKYADQLRESNDREGLRAEYLVDENTPTGTCAVILSNNDRSLCTRLGAANNYKLEHLKSPEIWKFVEDAKYFYVGGFHLTVCVPAILALGEHAAENNKVFIMNLSAPFLCQFFKEQMDSVAPYWDYLIGNESEALAYAEAHDLKTKDITEIAKHFAKLPKKNTQRQRIVIITQGAESTIVAQAQGSGEVKVDTFVVNKIDPSKIVDTNGAGDAFAGGFLGTLAQGKNLEESIHGGHWLASESISLMGPNVRLLFPIHLPYIRSQADQSPAVSRPKEDLQGLKSSQTKTIEDTTTKAGWRCIQHGQQQLSPRREELVRYRRNSDRLCDQKSDVLFQKGIVVPRLLSCVIGKFLFFF